MPQIIELKGVTKESKMLLLEELGFSSDGTYVLEKDGNKVYDKYIDEPVTIDNMAILPGSTIILDNNPLSIALYLEEYPNGV
ncbi:MAG: hypothetical protein LBC12_00410 [Nitrososphaerota archaeon]|nr:hypothetical protein [Nitrososphaerota archaeon]